VERLIFFFHMAQIEIREKVETGMKIYFKKKKNRQRM
jgi:hypothetical protein